MDKKQLEALWFGIYFFIPFFGFKLMLENYLMEDELPIIISLLIGLASGIITAGLDFITKNKTVLTKIIYTLVLLMIIVGLNIFYHYN